MKIYIFITQLNFANPTCVGRVVLEATHFCTSIDLVYSVFDIYGRSMFSSQIVYLCNKLESRKYVQPEIQNVQHYHHIIKKSFIL